MAKVVIVSKTKRAIYDPVYFHDTVKKYKMLLNKKRVLTKDDVNGILWEDLITNIKRGYLTRDGSKILSEIYVFNKIIESLADVITMDLSELADYLDLHEDVLEMIIEEWIKEGVLTGVKYNPSKKVVIVTGRLTREFKVIERRLMVSEAHELSVSKVKPMTDDLNRFKEYKIINKIGSGGFSTVYLVEKNGMKYAMKVPQIKLDETVSSDLLDVFRKEMEIWKLLSEKNIHGVVKLVDYGLLPYPWMVMEYIEGGSLRKYWKVECS